MEDRKKYRSLPGIEMTSFGQEYYLVKARKLSAERDKYLISMNEIAAFYWTLIGEPKTREELLDALCGEYEVADRESAGSDLDRLMESWISAGCVAVCE